MTVSHNKAFIAQCAFVRTIYPHGNVRMTFCIDAPNVVIWAQIQLFSVTNDALVVATIPFVSVSTANPNTISCWYLFFWVGEVDQLTVSFVECYGVVRILLAFDIISASTALQRLQSHEVM